MSFEEGLVDPANEASAVMLGTPTVVVVVVVVVVVEVVYRHW